MASSGIALLRGFLACLPLAGCGNNSPEELTYKSAAPLAAGITSEFDAEKRAVGGVGDQWKTLTDDDQKIYMTYRGVIRTPAPGHRLRSGFPP